MATTREMSWLTSQPIYRCILCLSPVALVQHNILERIRLSRCHLARPARSRNPVPPRQIAGDENMGEEGHSSGQRAQGES